MNRNYYLILPLLLHCAIYPVEVDEFNDAESSTPPFIALKLKQQVTRITYKEKLEQLSQEKKDTIDYQETLRRIQHDDFHELGPTFHAISQLCQED